jgi:hypothetical protein
MADLEVITMGRIGVDLYPEQIGVSHKEVKTFAKSLGGSATNVAFAAARLGHEAAVITKVGDDGFGLYLRERSSGSSVSMRGGWAPTPHCGCRSLSARSSHRRFSPPVLPGAQAGDGRDHAADAPPRGDPGRDVEKTFEGWRRAMQNPQVRGLVAGRALLYPGGDVAGAVDEAATIVSEGAKPRREAEVR